MTDVKSEVDNNFYRFSSKGSVGFGKPGLPQLLMQPTNIFIPNKIKNIVVKPILSKRYVMDKQLFPMQKIQPFSKMQYDFIYNKTFYREKDAMLESQYSINGIGYSRGYPILSIFLFPINYIPQKNEILIYEKFLITVEMDEYSSMDINHFKRDKPSDIVYVNSLIENNIEKERFAKTDKPMGYSGGICNSADTYEWVLITNESLNNTEGKYNWSDLLTHRSEQSNLNTTVVTTGRIDTCQDYWNSTDKFNDSAAHIREFCKDAYQDWGTEYILIGGTWYSDSKIVPYRIFYDGRVDNESQDHYPCDMYYSHLDGNWSRDSWGWGGKSGDQRDFYAELNIARVPVYNATHISNFVEKTICYDTCDDVSFLNRTAFFGGNMGWTSTSAEYMEEIRNGTVGVDGFTTWNAENPDWKFDISQREYYDWGASVPSDFQTIMNADDVCFINHIGHGSVTGSLNMNSGQMNSISNTKLMFLYTQECSSGDWGGSKIPTATTWILNSNDTKMFGSIQNTGYGWGDSVSTDGPNHKGHENFWHYLFNEDFDNWTVGKAFTFGKDEMGFVCAGYEHYAWHGGWYGTHLFADPALKLKLTNEADPITTREFSVSHETRFDADWLNISIYAENASKVIINITDSENSITNRSVMNNSGFYYWHNTSIWGKKGDSTIYMYIYNLNHTNKTVVEDIYFYPSSDPNTDRCVDAFDLTFVKSNNWSGSGDIRFCISDINADGTVDAYDLTYIKSISWNWDDE